MKYYSVSSFEAIIILYNVIEYIFLFIQTRIFKLLFIISSNLIKRVKNWFPTGF